jgi:hypothetical protein
MQTQPEPEERVPEVPDGPSSPADDEGSPPSQGDDGWNIRCRCGHEAPLDSFTSDNPRLKGWYVCPGCKIVFKPENGKLIVMQEDGPLWDRIRLDRLKARLEREKQERIEEWERLNKEDHKRWLATRRILKKNNIPLPNER